MFTSRAIARLFTSPFRGDIDMALLRSLGAIPGVRTMNISLLRSEAKDQRHYRNQWLSRRKH